MASVRKTPVPSMPNHLRLSLIGSFRKDGGGAVTEQFVMTSSWGQPGEVLSLPYTEADIEGIMDPLATACSNFWTGGALRMGRSVFLDEIKVANIAPTGKYVDGSNAHIRTLNIAGNAAGSYPYPSELALAVTTRNGGRGRSSHGRFYLPFPNIGLVDYVAQTTDVQNIANLCAEAFLTPGTAGTIASAFNAIAGGGAKKAQLILASTKGNSATAVTQIQVGVVPDVQRRRRRSLPEAYETGTAPSS